MIYTLDNIRAQSLKDNPVKVSYNTDSRTRTKWKTFKLEKNVDVVLSNGVKLKISKGFLWDLSSVPRVLSWILLPYGNFLIAALIHDYLYQYSDEIKHDYFGGDSEKARAFADKEMLLWSEAMQQTRRISFYNIDNKLRYRAVRLFGRSVWED